MKSGKSDTWIDQVSNNNLSILHSPLINHFNIFIKKILMRKKEFIFWRKSIKAKPLDCDGNKHERENFFYIIKLFGISILESKERLMKNNTPLNSSHFFFTSSHFADTFLFFIEFELTLLLLFCWKAIEKLALRWRWLNKKKLEEMWDKVFLHFVAFYWCCVKHWAWCDEESEKNEIKIMSRLKRAKQKHFRPSSLWMNKTKSLQKVSEIISLMITFFSSLHLSSRNKFVQKSKMKWKEEESLKKFIFSF